MPPKDLALARVALGIDGNARVGVLQATPPPSAVGDELIEVLRLGFRVEDLKVAEANGSLDAVTVTNDSKNSSTVSRSASSIGRTVFISGHATQQDADIINTPEPQYPARRVAVRMTVLR